MMLTAILLAYDTPARPLRRDAIARSLASLVEACVQGLVADAVLAGAPGRGLDRIADEAGCALVETTRIEEGLKQALALARHDDILLMLAGKAVERGFIEELNDVFNYGGFDRALVLRCAPASFVTRLFPRLEPPAGIVARKNALREAASADLKRLSKKLRGVELKSHARRTF
jgi:hypothetical protein